MLYGFSRDRAVPLWWLWTQIDDHGVPIYAGKSEFLVLPALTVIGIIASDVL